MLESAVDTSCDASASTCPALSSGSPSIPTAGPAAAADPHSPRSSASWASDEDMDEAVDPFYDPRADAADAAWVQRNLSAGGDACDSGTDVRLSCPSCFILLCVSAQAHIEYTGQWRAVFVRNCFASDRDTMRVKVDGAATSGEERFRPVACTRCRTEVGVLDEDDVYHFCNVLS
jgi:E2F-associated phosphoprotein